MITLKGNNGIYEGLSTDTKPSDVPVNTEFHELNTDKTYYFDGEEWNEEPSSGGGGNIASNNVTAMTGYEEAETASAITTSDTLNQAVGKLEKGVDDNKTNILLIQDHIKFDSSSKTYYLQQTQPANPAEGDIWIG